MDIFNVVYYALICGGLVYVMKPIKSIVHAVLAGMVVGAIAATLLPYLKVAFAG